MRLSGSLLGAPEPAQAPIKPPNPFAKDDLPKRPKIDWGDEGKLRIDREKRAMHENWARLINSTQDFGGIIPTFKRHIETNGDAGRADVADMIGRVSESNPDHARLFQRELSTALGGETIPARKAGMAGEPVGKTGLLGDAKSNRFSDPEFEKSYWRSAEAYKADFERRQREILKAAELKPKRPEDYVNYIRQPDPPATEKPRQDVLGKRGVISAKPENPANPDRGNFADKLARQPKSETKKPAPDFHPSVTIEFDGKELKAVENGQVVQSWPAVSGRPGFQTPDHQGEKNRGPLPEGEWVIRQGGYQQIPQGGVAKWYERVKNWSGGEDSWGKERVWVEPMQGTDAKGRSGFSVHGGKEPGSAGCIDLTGQMGVFAGYFRSLGKDVKIKVRYSRE